MKKFLVFILSLVLLIFIWKQYRHFYRVDDMTFTVWKRWGGYCYITPYRYWGLSEPKEDYIRASNIGQVDIYVDKDSTLLIFNDSYHLEYRNLVECHLAKYRYKHFGSDSTESLPKREEIELQRNAFRKKLPFIEINIREMRAVVGDAQK